METERATDDGGEHIAEELGRLGISGPSSSSAVPAVLTHFTSTTAESLNSLSPTDVFELLSPLSVLAKAAHPFQPQASDVLWRTFTPIAAGQSGRVFVGPFPKLNLSPQLSTLSGRVSRYPGNYELVTLKLPTGIKDPGTAVKDDEFGEAAEGAAAAATAVPFKDMLPELELLSSPQILYHDNIVDLLGYFWEPHGKGGQDALLAPTLILEFADQGSLRNFVEFGPAVSAKEKLGLCVDICRALQTLHHEMTIVGKEVGICHWDLKPDNILVFKNTNGTGYTAKLCDLGSCIRYQKGEGLPREQAGKGTPGWKAPELVSSLDAEQRISPAAADAYSFGLLVAYLMLGHDLFRVEPIAQYIFDNYPGPWDDAGTFPTSAHDIMRDQTHVEKVRIRLQEMIHQHTPRLLGFILDAVTALDFLQEDTQAVIDVLEQTIQPSPDDRSADFAVLTVVLGGDLEEKRHRTPVEPIIDFLSDPAGRISVPFAMALASITWTVMPEGFTSWFCEHLERVFNHVFQNENPDLAPVQAYLATLRGLLGFLPGGTPDNPAEGVSWLRRAALCGDPNAAVFASRVAAALNQTVDDDDDHRIAEILARAAEDGSIIAQELTGTVPTDGPLMTEAEAALESRLLARSCEAIVWPQHSLAFIRKSDALEYLIKDFIGHGWDLELESLDSIDAVNGGYLTYSVSAAGTALQWAVQMNNEAAARILVQAGASPYTVGKSQRNAWSIAVGARLLPIIEMFVDFCPCRDEEERRVWTMEGLCSGLFEAYLACGEAYVEKSFAMFRYLFARSLVPREQAYVSTVNPGSADCRLLERLLEEDFSPETDKDLLQKVLHHSVLVSNLEGVRRLLPLRDPLQSTDAMAVCLLSQSIAAPGRQSVDIFLLLLGHLAPDFNLDVRFTHLDSSAENPVRITDSEGMTLLHSTFSHGRALMTVELLRRGADPSLETIRTSSPGDGLNAFGMLFFADTHHNHLALAEFLESNYVVRENPGFVLDNAVVTRASRKTIFHLLCGDEQSRRHQSADNLAALTSLHKKHLRRVIKKGHPRRPELVRLVNTLMVEVAGEGEEKTMAPLHLAAASGYADAVGPLVKLGADPLVRVAADPASGFPGLTALHMADTRRGEVWDEEWDIYTGLMAAGGFPAIEKGSPVARKLRAEYEQRTEKTIGELSAVLRASREGRELWQRRAASMA